jgi:HEAT repeat protein
MTAPPNTVLADAARAEAERHAPRTPERRAAAWVFVAASETKTIDAARRALSDCPDPSVRYAATVLLRQLAEQDPDTNPAMTGNA